MNREQFIKYVDGLQVGEEVIETGYTVNHPNYGKKGTIYISDKPMTKGSKCVMWEDNMGTSVTHGTRRASEYKPCDGGCDKLVEIHPGATVTCMSCAMRQTEPLRRTPK